MTSPLKSLIASGTKVWLDSIDPDLVRRNRELGATGATSNPIIVADLLKTGRWDSDLSKLLSSGSTPSEAAWAMTDRLVSDAEKVFLPVFQDTGGNDGYVSFELDPLLEDEEQSLPLEERIEAYVTLGKKWSEGHPNRMIKVPATPAGIGALEALAEAGIPLNVTLIFTMRQYLAARDAVWRGAQKRKDLTGFKSVYSIFVSRLDVYSEQHLPDLGSGQGWLGIVNAKRIWKENKDFWSKNKTPLQQEIIFASTGTKKASDPAWKYVEAFAGSDIETNPPATNDAVEASGRIIEAKLHEMPEQSVLGAIDATLDSSHMEKTLMQEGLAKFADPQKALLDLVASHGA